MPFQISKELKRIFRMEWGWLNYAMECFNFGLKFREWVYMLFKKGKTCIKTNGFISKFFAIKTPNVFILSEIHDMLVNLGRFPLNLPINNPFVFS
jgi:hypothetical protein